MASVWFVLLLQMLFVLHQVHAGCLCSVTLDFIYNFFHFMYIVENYFQGEETFGSILSGCRLLLCITGREASHST